MVLFQFISDLHLEFLKPKLVHIKKFLIPSAPNLLILGDLVPPTHPNFKLFFDYYSPLFEHIYYVSGNHEYYSKKTYFEIEDCLKNECSKYPNVHYLNNQSILLENDNIVILGTTLWSNTLNNKYIKYDMNDYYKIYEKENKNVTTKFTTNLHLQAVEWLNSELELHRDKTILVLTHHLPSFKMIHEKYKDSQINDGFASHLDDIMNTHSNIKYWLCGHTHSAIHIRINQTECITNPCGYPGETTYNKKAIIEI